MGGKAKLTNKLAQQALTGLHKVADLLEAHDIPFWLESGTLLGAVREGRLLPWDNDLDLSIRSSDVHRLLRLKWPLLLRGYRVKKERFYQDYGPLKAGELRILKIKSWHLKAKAENKLLIDLFIKYPDEDRYYWSVGKKSIVNKSAPRHHYDTLDTIVFDNREFCIPSDVENYLTHRYGDWRTPVQEWNFKTDDKAVDRNAGATD